MNKPYTAKTAVIDGDVSFGKDVSLWHHAVIRADEDSISIGDGTNIQDGAILHTDPGFPMVIGKDVTIGHAAIVHGATIEDGALIGMGAILLNGSHIKKNAMVAAGALVPSGMIVEEGMLAIGSPARVMRPLKEEEIAANLANAKDYVHQAKRLQREENQ